MKIHKKSGNILNLSGFFTPGGKVNILIDPKIESLMGSYKIYSEIHIWGINDYGEHVISKKGGYYKKNAPKRIEAHLDSVLIKSSLRIPENIAVNDSVRLDLRGSIDYYTPSSKRLGGYYESSKRISDYLYITIQKNEKWHDERSLDLFYPKGIRLMLMIINAQICILFFITYANKYLFNGFDVIDYN